MNAMNFSDTQIADYKEAFALFDREGDGTVPAGDAGTVMRALSLNPTDQEVQYLLKEVGSFAGGTINFENFLVMMSAHMKEYRSDEKDAIAAFRSYDRSRSGYISAKELKHLVTNMGREKIDEDTFDEMIRKSDCVDKAGRIDYVAFVQKMCT